MNRRPKLFLIGATCKRQASPLLYAICADICAPSLGLDSLGVCHFVFARLLGLSPPIGLVGPMTSYPHIPFSLPIVPQHDTTIVVRSIRPNESAIVESKVAGDPSHGLHQCALNCARLPTQLGCMVEACVGIAGCPPLGKLLGKSNNTSNHNDRIVLGHNWWGKGDMGSLGQRALLGVTRPRALRTQSDTHAT